jgi:hypothetical protein
LSLCTVVKWLRMEKCCFMSVASTSSITTCTNDHNNQQDRASVPRHHTLTPRGVASTSKDTQAQITFRSYRAERGWEVSLIACFVPLRNC